MGTHVSSIVASLNFTSKSSDYVLSKAGLFSTQLSLSIIEPKIQHLQDTTQIHKIAIFVSFSRNHTIDLCACVSGVKDCKE